MAKSTRRGAGDDDFELEHDRPVTTEPDAYPEGQGDPQVRAAAAAYVPVPDIDPATNGEAHEREITDHVAGTDPGE